jgi:uncharacterized protein YecT (DUF1311 family)
LDKRSSRYPLIAIGAGLILIGSLLDAAALDCDEAEDQASLNACASEAYRAADAKLNATYRQVTSRLADLPDFHAALTRAQRAWIAYRDAECAFMTSAVAEASAYPMVADNCLEGITDARTEDLGGLLQCDEGDLGCPVPAE